MRFRESRRSRAPTIIAASPSRGRSDRSRRRYRELGQHDRAGELERKTRIADTFTDRDTVLASDR